MTNTMTTTPPDSDSITPSPPPPPPVSLYYPILFTFSLSFVLPSVVNMFKKNMYSIITFPTSTTTTHQLSNNNHRRSVSCSGLATATEDTYRLPNVLESATLKPNNGNSLPPVVKSTEFIGGGGGVVVVDGLMSCTESLGFESSNERVIDDTMDIIHNEKLMNDYNSHDEEDDDDELWRRRLMMRRAESRLNWRKVRSFPPPLSSLNRNGKPSFYLRPVRKDGRLELTEVRIHRPEILHASRQDGRLTLHLIPDQEEEEEEEDEEVEEEEEQELVQEEEEEEQELVVEEEEEEISGSDSEREDDHRVLDEEWGYGPSVPGGVESNNEGGYNRRCHEMVNQHHNHLRMCGISIV